MKCLRGSICLKSSKLACLDLCRLIWCMVVGVLDEEVLLAIMEVYYFGPVECRQTEVKCEQVICSRMSGRT